MQSHNHSPIPTAVKLDKQLKLRLQKLGEIKDRSIHWLMKEAIEHYVSREEKAEQLKKETLSRWQEVEAGKVVSDKAVMAWLDTWGTENETGRPPCED